MKDSVKLTIPGQKIALAVNYSPGPGTYNQDGCIYASLVGRLEIVKSSGGELPKLRISRDKDSSAVPCVGSTVIGKTVRVNSRFATLKIMVVGTKNCKEAYQGIIRVQDVTVDKGKVQICKSFRPGDVVRAEVISLGDARSYYLSTARNDLGVIFAESISGYAMVPISWDKMMCTKTKNIEYRKCTKPLVREQQDNKKDD